MLPHLRFVAFCDLVDSYVQHGTESSISYHETGVLESVEDYQMAISCTEPEYLVIEAVELPSTQVSSVVLVTTENELLEEIIPISDDEIVCQRECTYGEHDIQKTSDDCGITLSLKISFRKVRIVLEIQRRGNLLHTKTFGHTADQTGRVETNWRVMNRILGLVRLVFDRGKVMRLC